MVLNRRQAILRTGGGALPTARRQRHGTRDRSLDGLRGLAVLLVFLFHYGGGLQSGHLILRLVGYVTEACWVGVELFFVLSGFLITGSLWDSQKEQNWLRNFYARRALRILPLYLSVILLCALISVARGTALVELKPFVLFAFFLQDLPFLSQSALSLNPSPLPLYHLWTLAVEEQFYLFWPLLLLTVPKRRAAVRLSLGVFAVAALFRLAVWGLPQLESIQRAQIFDPFLLTHVGGLALGAAVALGVRSSQPGKSSPSHRFIYKHPETAFQLGVFLFLFSSFKAKTLALVGPLQYMLGLPAVSLACAATLPLLLRPGKPRHFFSLAPLGYLGRLSYGFYIFHILLQPIFDSAASHITHSSAGDPYQAARLLIAFPLSLGAAWLSYHLLETPFLRRKSQFPMHSALP